MNTNKKEAPEFNNLIIKLTEQNALMSAEICEWKKLFEQATKEAFDLKAENQVLKDNISKLFNTAKSDTEKSSKKISELEKQIDDLLYNQFRSNNSNMLKDDSKVQMKYNDRKKNDNMFTNRNDRRSHSREKSRKVSPKRDIDLREGKAQPPEHIDCSQFKLGTNNTRDERYDPFSSTSKSGKKTRRGKHSLDSIHRREHVQLIKSQNSTFSQIEDEKNVLGSGICHILDKNQVNLIQANSYIERRSISPECPF